MNSSYRINKHMENNTMTLFETIVDELSGKEFTKEDLQQLQERHQVARRQAVTRHQAPIKIPPLNSTKFTEEEWQKHHAMKDIRCTGSGSTLWQELYSNEEDCNKIMEIDNAELRMRRKKYEQEQEEENKRKKIYSEEELKLKNEKYQKEKKVKLMKHYGLFDK